jgi:methyltransferase
MILALTIVALVAAQRLLELVYAQRNTRALLARGGREIGREHYPLFVVLHAAWLAAIVLALPRPPTIHWLPLAAYAVLEVLRAWTVLSLGPYWTTRIITLPEAPLIKRGPYRFLRHPNYLIVMGEILLLPLCFGEIWIAIAFTVLNAGLLAWRIRTEETALAPRRTL